jgi:hypothetical protein
MPRTLLSSSLASSDRLLKLAVVYISPVLNHESKNGYVNIGLLLISATEPLPCHPCYCPQRTEAQALVIHVLILCYYFVFYTNHIEKSSCVADYHSSGQEIPQPLVEPYDSFSFFATHISMIFSPNSKFSNFSLTFRFPDQNVVFISYLFLI